MHINMAQPQAVSFPLAVGACHHHDHPHDDRCMTPSRPFFNPADFSLFAPGQAVDHGDSTSHDDSCLVGNGCAGLGLSLEQPAQYSPPLHLLAGLQQGYNANPGWVGAASAFRLSPSPLPLSSQPLQRNHSSSSWDDANAFSSSCGSQCPGSEGQCSGFCASLLPCGKTSYQTEPTPRSCMLTRRNPSDKATKCREENCEKPAVAPDVAHSASILQSFRPSMQQQGQHAFGESHSLRVPGRCLCCVLIDTLAVNGIPQPTMAPGFSDGYLPSSPCFNGNFNPSSTAEWPNPFQPMDQSPAYVSNPVMDNPSGLTTMQGSPPEAAYLQDPMVAGATGGGIWPQDNVSTDGKFGDLDYLEPQSASNSEPAVLYGQGGQAGYWSSPASSHSTQDLGQQHTGHICKWGGRDDGIVCWQRFATAKDLHTHIAEFHVEPLPKTEHGFMCAWQGCDRAGDPRKKGFSQRSKLKRHMEIHTGSGT